MMGLCNLSDPSKRWRKPVLKFWSLKCKIQLLSERAFEKRKSDERQEMETFGTVECLPEGKPCHGSVLLKT